MLINVLKFYEKNKCIKVGERERERKIEKVKRFLLQIITIGKQDANMLGGFSNNYYYYYYYYYYLVEPTNY